MHFVGRLTENMYGFRDVANLAMVLQTDARVSSDCPTRVNLVYLLHVSCGARWLRSLMKRWVNQVSEEQELTYWNTRI